MVKVKNHKHINLRMFGDEHLLLGFADTVYARLDYPRNDTSVYDQVFSPKEDMDDWDDLSEIEREGYTILVEEYGFAPGETIVWDICW